MVNPGHCLSDIPFVSLLFLGSSLARASSVKTGVRAGSGVRTETNSSVSSGDECRVLSEDTEAERDVKF